MSHCECMCRRLCLLSNAALRASMHQIASAAFHKMVAKHRESLIQYHKAIASFILKTEVCDVPLVFILGLLIFCAECS
jgi:hypothetical protein